MSERDGYRDEFEVKPERDYLVSCVDEVWDENSRHDEWSEAETLVGTESGLRTGFQRFRSGHVGGHFEISKKAVRKVKPRAMGWSEKRFSSKISVEGSGDEKKQ